MTTCGRAWVESWGPKSCHLPTGHTGDHWTTSGFMLPNEAEDPEAAAAGIRARAWTAREIAAYHLDTLPEPPAWMTR